MPGPKIQFQAVQKQYPRGARVFDCFDLVIEPGEFVVLFGSIGSGKTTLIRMIAGLEEKSGGDLLVGGMPPGSRCTGYVFQSATASLFPWTSAVGNVAFALDVATGTSNWEQIWPGLKGLAVNLLVPDTFRERLVRSMRDRSSLAVESRKSIATGPNHRPAPQRPYASELARKVLADVGFETELMEKYPYELSGGQCQLIALARALAPDPDLLLLDEPFRNLDHNTSLQVQEHLWDWWRRRRSTVIISSHEVERAVALGSRVISLGDEQPTQIVFDKPTGFPDERDFETLQVSPEMVSLKKELLGRNKRDRRQETGSIV